MSELERQLQALAPLVELPAERRLAPAVRERLTGRPTLRRRLAPALALVVFAIGIAFAVPPARSAILRWLHLGGVRIEFVDRLPTATVRQTLELGPRTTLAQARHLVAYRVLTSKLLGDADEVHVLGSQVGFVYRRKGGVKLLVTEFPGYEPGNVAQKMVGPGTRVELVSVNGAQGVWVSGSPHFFLYLRTDGRVAGGTLFLAGNTLLWDHDRVTLRLEGRLTREQALEIASSFR